jgi:HSP20 family protein
MAIQKWDPIREFDRLHDEFDRLFQGRQGQRSALAEDTCPLAVDILENVEEVLLRAELPGVKSDAVSVKVEDDVLTISGAKKFEHDEKKDTYLRVERYYGNFSRSFTLPPYVDANKIIAEYKDGVLTLHLPKKPETKPRQIQVKVG